MARYNRLVSPSSRDVLTSSSFAMLRAMGTARAAAALLVMSSVHTCIRGAKNETNEQSTTREGTGDINDRKTPASVSTP